MNRQNSKSRSMLHRGANGCRNTAMTTMFSLRAMVSAVSKRSPAFVGVALTLGLLCTAPAVAAERTTIGGKALLYFIPPPEPAGTGCGEGDWWERFVVHGSEVCDNETGLYWIRFPDEVQRSHAESVTHCSTPNPANGMTYRMPELKELLHLVDYGEIYPALPAGHPFGNIQYHYYPFWSATQSAASGTSVRAWAVDFYLGYLETINIGNTASVWCTR